MSKKEDIEASDTDTPIGSVRHVNDVCHLYHGVKMGLKLVAQRRASMEEKKKRGEEENRRRWKRKRETI